MLFRIQGFVCLSAHLSPAGWPPALVVLDEQVGGANLARLSALCYQAPTMVLCHVHLELLRVGPRWGLPARVLLRGVEVVGQVLALAMANLPIGGESRVGLLHRVATMLAITGRGMREENKQGSTHVAHGGLLGKSTRVYIYVYICGWIKG